MAIGPVSHDLGAVRHVTSQVAVMYLGKIVEHGRTDGLFMRPLHPYTEALLSAIPVPQPELARSRERIVLTGDVPSPADPPPGCNFHPRCPYADWSIPVRCSTSRSGWTATSTRSRTCGRAEA